jgi:hypothetical protein
LPRAEIEPPDWAAFSLWVVGERFLPWLLPDTYPAPTPSDRIFLAGFRHRLLEDAMSVKHLNQIDLARRWSISPRTLERWRWLGQGPRYIKIGGRVVYRIDEVEAFEAQQTRASTAELPQPRALARSA